MRPPPSSEAAPRTDRELRSRDGGVGVGQGNGRKPSSRGKLDPAESSLKISLAAVHPRAIVASAVFRVTARAAGIGPVTGVAVVRSAEVPAGVEAAHACIIDFQKMRTVNLVRIKQEGGDEIAIDQLRAWLGTRFDETPLASTRATSIRFGEVQTERLLVIGDATVAELEELGEVRLPSPPGDLEILLGATRLWARPGPVRPEGEDAVFTIDVDLTAAIQAAVDAAAPGDFPLELVLNAGAPGDLGFSVHELDVSTIYPVPLPDQGARTVVFAEEGRQTLDLPLGSGSAGWVVSQVRAVVEARLPPARIVPAEGPTLTGEAELLLDAERAVVVLLPSGQLDPFDALAAVRLPVLVDEGTAELVAVLRADAAGRPGEPLPGPSLGPITVEARPRADGPAWVTLSAPRPQALQPGAPLWLAVQITRGRLSLLVNAPGATPPNRIWRGLPNGPFKELPAIAGVWPDGLSGAIRLVGLPSADQPIEALKAWVTGSSSGVEFTPTEQGIEMSLDVSSRPPGTTLPVLLVASAPGAYRFRAVEVVYHL
ncbi:MAG TPA: hypothetical protein VKB80_35560 [Kofleriaceae bacterium]|nr:hypothetical protein [Kofleriaceae bacterium]